MVALCHLWSLGLYEFYFCNSKDCFMNLLAILGIGISLKESLNLERALKKMPIFGKTNENAVSFYTCELFSDIQIPNSF